MAGDLRDAVVLVTGGANGLGRATCVAAAERGAVVVVADRDGDGARAVARELGGHAIEVDVADLEANRAMVAAAVERTGGLDHVFLNAGVTSGTGVGDDFDLERYRRAMAVNLDGVVFGVHAALPALRDRGGGSIVATASLAGLTAVPLDPIYAANKHAVVGLCRSLGPALAHDRIRVNAVCPGFAESNMTAPFRDELIAAGFRMIPAEDVAAVVLGLFEAEGTGEAWFVQPGRAGAFAFRNVPGPREL